LDYSKHYQNLVNRAKHRRLDSYVETHHIVPKCLGGSHDRDNLVELTPEEHYLAHLLLMKIYPNEPKLVYAAHMMTRGNGCHSWARSGNKLYGWLRRKHSVTMSEDMKGKRCGEENSQFGTCWISKLSGRVSKKIKKELLPEYIHNGWVKGRYAWNEIKKCKNCSKEYTPNNCEIYCSDLCKSNRKIKMKEPTVNAEREYYNRLFLEYINGEYTSMRQFVYVHKKYNKSHVSLTKNFKKYVKDYCEIIKKKIVHLV